MQNRPFVTAIIKVKNEAQNIQGAILSARGLCSRIIVIDDNSTDESAQIALSLGAEVIKGQPHQGQIDKLDIQGFQLVESGWILRMDADERLNERFVEVVTPLMMSEGICGIRYARLNFMFGDFMRHGGWFRPQTLGLFRAETWDRSWDASLHSQVPVIGKVVVIPAKRAHVEHLDYLETKEFAFRSLYSYASEEARERFFSGERFQISRMIYHPTRRFIGRYFIRLGFLDGTRGFICATLLAMYDFCVYMNIWDLSRKQ